MSQLQKIIKYSAMAFALFLTVNIFGAIFVGIAAIGNLFDSNEDVVLDAFEVLEVSGDFFNDLEIEVASASIVIKEGDSFKIETNNKYIKVKERFGQLLIEESNPSLIHNTNSSLVISIPADSQFDEVSIESGAGKLEIENLISRDVGLDLGAGKVEFENLVVLGELDVDGGAGAIEIKNGSINNLDLDMGVGKLIMKANITGKSDIDAGVGDCDITLLGSRDDYKIKINKGIGDAVIEGKSVENNTYYGNGLSTVLIDGGIGKINIKFAQ